MTITIELEIETDETSETYDESLKEAVYEYLLQLIDDDSLDFTVEK